MERATIVRKRSWFISSSVALSLDKIKKMLQHKVVNFIVQQVDPL